MMLSKVQPVLLVIAAATGAKGLRLQAKLGGKYFFEQNTVTVKRPDGRSDEVIASFEVKEGDSYRRPLTTADDIKWEVAAREVLGENGVELSRGSEKSADVAALAKRLHLFAFGEEDALTGPTEIGGDITELFLLEEEKPKVGDLFTFADSYPDDMGRVDVGDVMQSEHVRLYTTRLIREGVEQHIPASTRLEELVKEGVSVFALPMNDKVDDEVSVFFRIGNPAGRDPVLHVNMRVIFFDDASQPGRVGVIDDLDDKDQAMAVVEFDDGERKKVPKSELSAAPAIFRQWSENKDAPAHKYFGVSSIMTVKELLEEKFMPDVSGYNTYSFRPTVAGALGPCVWHVGKLNRDNVSVRRDGQYHSLSDDERNVNTIAELAAKYGTKDLEFGLEFNSTAR